jgi:hypothetical protein
MSREFTQWEVRWRTYERGRVFGYIVKARTASEAYTKGSRKFDAEIDQGVFDKRWHWWLPWGGIQQISH